MVPQRVLSAVVVAPAFAARTPESGLEGVVVTWFPIGPDFTFAPNDSQSWTRLSRRNEGGAQATVDVITVDPANPQTIYIASNPWAGGSGAFRTDDGGASWSSIVDDLAAVRPASSSPTAIALNPANSAIVYMGWSDGAFTVSTNKGVPTSWAPAHIVHNGATVTNIVVDPGTAAGPKPTIYAGTSLGLFISLDGGTTWQDVTVDQNGKPYVDPNPSTGGGRPAVDSLIADFSGAAPQLYAALRNTGVVYSTNPLTTGWTSLNAMSIGLPNLAGKNNRTAVRLALCPLMPNRLYAWFLDPDKNGGSTVGIYTTASATTAWTQVPCPSPPPGYAGDVYAYSFAACPNSPGDGSTDILLFGNNLLHRSTDGGQSWTTSPNFLHTDHHAFAFAPQAGSPIPAVYAGCDGGIGVSSSLADPSVALTLPAAAYNEGASYDSTSWLFQNLDHGYMASALFSYASHRSIPAVSYIACGDTGVAAGTGSLGWRSIVGADSYAVAASPGPDGVTVWYDSGLTAGFPPFPVVCVTDNGRNQLQSASGANLGTNAVARTTQHLALDAAGLCVAGLQAHVSFGTLASPIVSAGTQTVTLTSTAGIVPGTILFINWGKTHEEAVTVTAVTGTTIQATFAKTHIAGEPIEQQLTFVGRIDRAGVVTQISQDFQSLAPTALVVAASNPDLYVCAVQDAASAQNGVLFHTATGSSANALTVWTQLGTTMPYSATTKNAISSIAVDSAGTIYVLLSQPAGATNTPLYRVDLTGTWTPIATTSLPNGTAFGACVADPVPPNVLYASLDGGVYTVSISGNNATWQPIVDNLPGPIVYDLWVANIGTGTAPKVLLRCAVAGRGTYERDVTMNAAEPPVALYMRAHALDMSWFSKVQDGIPNPFNPVEPLYHYTSADIKVDPQVQGSTPYFATDPESAPPISHVEFDLLSSDGSNLPQQTNANVHVQVNNRSTTAQDVWVWAIYCAGAAGVASLSADPPGNNFAFWSQFLADGTIAPNLPAASPWTSLGAPVLLTNVDAAHPQVASWNWAIPTAMHGNHHCLVAFANCAQAPLSASSYNVDAIVMTNRQVAQKNLTLLSPSPPGPQAPTPSHHTISMTFNNPTARPRVSSWHFDLRALPAHVRARVLLPKVAFGRSLDHSLHEFAQARRRPADHERFHHVLAASGGTHAIISDVEIPPFGAHVVQIEVNGIDRQHGLRHRFHVQQVIGGRVVGGNLVVIADEPRKRRRIVAKDEPRIDRHVDVPLAPWIQAHVSARRKQLGRS